MQPSTGKRRVFLTVLAAILLATSTFSCGSLGKRKDSQENMMVSVDGFNGAIRWEDFKAAYLCLDPALQGEFWDLADTLHKSVRIMDYEVRNVNLNPEKHTATLAISYRYYFTHNPKLQAKTLQQRWQFYEKDKSWRVVHHELKELLSEKL